MITATEGRAEQINTGQGAAGLREEVVVFGSASFLVGIVTLPNDPNSSASMPGVLLLNSGIAHRVGTSRFYVRLARHLASLGFTVLRFDFSGIGDSTVRTDGRTFEEGCVLEAQEAMNLLARKFGCDRFIVGGICYGSGIAYNVACKDERVAGALLINHLLVYGEDFWEEAQGRAAVRSAISTSVRSAQSWLRLFRGDVRLWSKIRRLRTGILAKLKKNSMARIAPRLEQDRVELHALSEREVPLLFAFAEYDPAFDSFQMAWVRNVHQDDQAHWTVDLIEGSDHTFTLAVNQQLLFESIRSWLSMTYGTAPGVNVADN